MAPHPRDLAAINAYENVAGGLYVRRMLAVLHRGRREPALVYVAVRTGEGTPRPGYIDAVVEAARDWDLPESYIRSRCGGRRPAGEAPGRRIRERSDERPQVRRIVVRGRVQGVGYRAWTEDTAILNGLDGWVRNRRDGSVEAVFAGPAAAVEAMIQACRRGPDSARVEAVEQHDAGPDEVAMRRGADGFSVLPTI